jgi:hypothetical protein
MIRTTLGRCPSFVWAATGVAERAAVKTDASSTIRRIETSAGWLPELNVA